MKKPTAAVPKCSPHGWTVDTLETHLSNKIHSLEKMADEREGRTVERFASMQVAVNKAEVAMNERLAGMNEFRAALNDQSKLAITRGEYQIQHAALVEKIEALALRMVSIDESFRGNMAGRGAMGTIIMSAFITLSVLMSVAAFILDLIHR